MKLKILSCKPKNHPFPILSWMIRYFQKTNYSHNAIQYGSYILDASGSDVSINSSWYFFNKYEVVDLVEIDINANFEQFVNWTLLFVNRKYGLMQLVGIALYIMGLTKKVWFGKEDKQLICSELVILLLRDFKGLKVKDSDDYDLNSTWELVKEYGVKNDNVSNT